MKNSIDSYSSGCGTTFIRSIWADSRLRSLCYIIPLSMTFLTSMIPCLYDQNQNNCTNYSPPGDSGITLLAACTPANDPSLVSWAGNLRSLFTP